MGNLIEPDWHTVNTLLRNSAKFLSQAAREIHLSKEQPDFVSFSCLHSAIGLELMFKGMLYSEHWALVFPTPETGAKFDRSISEGRTIGAIEALDRIINVAEFLVTDRDAKAYRSIQKIRNQIVHGHCEIKNEKATALVARSIHLFFNFHPWYGFELDNETKAVIRSLQNSVSGFDKFIETRMSEIKPALGDCLPAPCPLCLADAFQSSPGMKCVLCGVCNYKADWADLPESTSLECSTCGSSIFYVVETTRIEYEGRRATEGLAVCGGCGDHLVFEECLLCGTEHINDDTLCLDCAKHISNRKNS